MGQAREFLATFDFRFPRDFCLFLRLWKLLTRTSFFVWRSYLRPSPPGVVFLCHSSQAFLCSPPQLCKWRSLAPWTECKSYSVISLSLRATDQRKQKLYWLGSPDENQPVALKFPSVFKIPYLALLANQQAHKSMEAYLQSWLFKEIYAHHSPGSDSCAGERRE